MILREHYLQQIRPFYESDLIKVITGIRRCGKSTLLEQIGAELKRMSANVIHLEFERRQTRQAIPDVDSLLQYVANHRQAGRCYLLLDEIQELGNWHEACQSLRLEECSVFVTGSNSKLLSSEFTRLLSGRYVSFHIYPFVYKEICEFSRELGKAPEIIDYLIWGGLPQRLLFDGEARRRFLEDLDETIIYKDIIVRHSIRKTELFRAVADFVLRSNARIVSANSIFKAIRQKHPCNLNTIVNFLGYLRDAYAIEEIRQYSSKTKQELVYYPKLYNGDVALNSIRCPDSRYDLDHNLENIVYLELLYMGYQLRVYNHNGREIDFLAEKGNRRYYIQVAYSVQDEVAYAREFRAFEKLDDTLSQRVLISTDELDYSTSIVRHIPLRRFLQLAEL